MEKLVMKYEQRYRRAKEELTKWTDHQARLIALFGAAAAILTRLPVLAKQGNYGVLSEIDWMTRDLCAKQIESLEAIFQSMHATLRDFERVTKALEKLSRDGTNLYRSHRPQPSKEQFQRRTGAAPSLHDCVTGLQFIHDMHRDELHLKMKIVETLSCETRLEDVAKLATVLADQPNLPADEVRTIFSLVLRDD